MAGDLAKWPSKRHQTTKIGLSGGCGKTEIPQTVKMLVHSPRILSYQGSVGMDVGGCYAAVFTRQA